ncbi:MAG TPA: transposase [Anaerolineae bacterium]|nr:transposase [Anaerolineae bacterium]
MPQLIPPQELCSLLLWFAPCFTQPSFAHFVSFIVCFGCGLGRMTATTVYRTNPRDSHWTNYSRFLSAYRWSVQALSARLLQLLMERCGLWLDDQGRHRLCVVIDETIVEKSSKRMPGVAWQRNTHGGWCRGTHILGHYWLMVGLLVRVAGRTMCLPLAFGLYRQKQRCPADEYRTPCQVALALLQSLPWPSAPDLVRTVVADAGFADQHLLRWCAEHDFVAIVRGRIDAQVHDLYVPPTRRGRPRVWGATLSLAERAADERNFTQTVALYQSRTPVQLASVVGRHRVSGLPMRFVILRTAGKDDAVVMSTDLSLTPREVAGLYADRFAIEMTFRELKQHFGLGDYQVRLPEAMLRHVHLAGVACALTQLLTLRPRQRRRMAGKATPWRRYGAVSVHETQLQLRLACQTRPHFTHVALRRPHRQKSQAPRQALTAPKMAMRKC